MKGFYHLQTLEKPAPALPLGGEGNLIFFPAFAEGASAYSKRPASAGVGGLRRLAAGEGSSSGCFLH